MVNILEISGIALQLFAGLLFIISGVDPKWIRNRGKSLQRLMDKLLGDIRRKRAIAFFVAISTLALWFVIGVAFSEERTPIVELVFGSIMGTAFVVSIYMYSLVRVAKLLMRLRPNKYEMVASATTESNILLFIISLLLLVTAGLVGQAYHNSSQELWQTILVSLYMFPTILFGVPNIMSSSVYLGTITSLHLMDRLRRMPARRFWVSIVMVWLIGGCLILASACLS